MRNTIRTNISGIRCRSGR